MTDRRDGMFKRRSSLSKKWKATLDCQSDLNTSVIKPHLHSLQLGCLHKNVKNYWTIIIQWNLYLTNLYLTNSSVK